MIEKDLLDFKEKLTDTLDKVSGKILTEITENDIYRAIGSLLRDEIGINWSKTRTEYREKKVKQVYYLSMEFLTGKFTEKNLQYLGMYEIIKAAVERLGFNFENVLRIEMEPGLGNGGLGRLAAAFLDSLSSLKLPGHGYGLRYEKGLFKQVIEDGKQLEAPDDWIKDIDMWQYKREDVIYEVKLGGKVKTFDKEGKLHFEHVDYESVKAEAFDIPILGYKNDVVNTLRLWRSESYEDINFVEFSSGNLKKAFAKINEARSITQFLYPDDSNYEGKKLRLKQEYFLVSASVQDIIRNYKKLDEPIEKIPDYVAIHTNDTHPALAIPEFMRILLDEEILEWDDAWTLTKEVFAFTNHTILTEAMEVWNLDLFKETLPRIFGIIEEINHRFIHFLKNVKKINLDLELNKLSIIWNNKVRMVNLSIVGSHSINGVAWLHTEILKHRELNHFYKIFPEKFNNKTNGIIHRKWLLTANRELTSFLEEKIGSEFKKDALKLEDLMEYRKDKNTLYRLYNIKLNNKKKLADIIYKEQGIVLNPYSIFDVHIKRIHEYKRQLLNLLHIIYLYDKLIENPNLDIVPRTFIFAGKAAPSYYAAKEIIRLINAVADLVNWDINIKDKIKVVFIENYNVSSAEEIIPAADVSEQISTTTKEASGTGNMKFMMNGAITLATLDGANIEIYNEVGDENIVIFGMRDDKVYEYYAKENYNSKKLYYTNQVIKRTVDRLIEDDYFNNGENFRSLYDLLINYNDNFFVLEDFEDYIEAQEKIGKLYRDRDKWMEISLVNIGKSGTFSSDNTIRKYSDEIWKIRPI